MQNIVRQLITEVSCETEESNLYVTTTRTFNIGDKRKIVVEEETRRGHRFPDVTIKAYINDPHEDVWYDCDGNECTSHVEWRKVFHEKTAHYDWLVDNVIAKAYGVLMCAMV